MRFLCFFRIFGLAYARIKESSDLHTVHLFWRIICSFRKMEKKKKKEKKKNPAQNLTGLANQVWNQGLLCSTRVTRPVEH